MFSSTITPTDQLLREYLIFDYAGIGFCLCTQLISTIVDPEEESPSDLTVLLEKGIIIYHDEIIRLLDLNAYYGFKLSSQTKNNRIIIMNYNNKQFAFFVDKVAESISLDKEALRALKIIMPANQVCSTAQQNKRSEKIMFS